MHCYFLRYSFRTRLTSYKVYCPPLVFLPPCCYTDATMKYIASDPQIMGGTPVIKGTRTPVEVILYRLKEGNSLGAIHDLYPWIALQTLEGAVDEAIHLISSSSHGKDISQA